MENIKQITLTDFEALFRTHYASLCAFANKYLEDIEASEEVVQDLFVRFWENREKNDIRTSLRSYFYTAVKNTCLNQLKHLKIKEAYKQHNQREIDQAEQSVDDKLEAGELDLKIRASIEALPDGRKKIFMLSRNDGLKYQEIADQLGISVKTVENQMTEALKFLRHELRDFLVFLFIVIQFMDDLG